MGIEEIGCCGAYCGTCPVIKENMCRGCKPGYLTGERDIHKAKCKMKVCCINHGHPTCADCAEYDTCAVLQEFFGKNGYKYRKYHQALDYIRANGYERFIAVADGWKIQYGKYDDSGSVEP